tara:strand:+ start:1171 stop:1560 length:390 start_codon:yes stop_codon:yes gene_type:complete
MNRRSRKSKFRSVFEEHTAEVLKGFEYEPYTVPYTIHRNYTPDFVHVPSNTLVECKGFFREGDTKKYTSIRDSLKDYQSLVFVLMNPNKKVRKGGKITMSQWCEKQGLEWYTLDTLQELMDDVSNNGGN